MSLKIDKSRKRIIIYACIAAGILVVFLTAYAIYRVLHPRKVSGPDAGIKNPPIERLSRGNINSFNYSGDTEAFIAYMYDSNISDTVFRTFFGYESITLTKAVPSIRVLGDGIRKTFADIPDEEFPYYIIIGLDPCSAYLQSCSNSDLYRNQLEFIRELALDHPDCRLLITLPDDSAVKWASLEGQSLTRARTSYITTVRQLSGLPNLRILYNSVEEWVLYSDCIREDGPMSPLLGNIDSSLLALNIDPNNFSHVLNSDNVNGIMDSVIESSGRYTEAAGSYADLTGKDVYFIGDSIFGNYRDETSVSSFFRDMTGARVFNLGEGGMAAVNVADPSSPMGAAFNYLLGNEELYIFNGRCYEFNSYYSYWQAADVLSSTKGENSVFIVEFGLNDYFSGVSQEDFRTAMDTIISKLKTAYPRAEIVVLSPGYIRLFVDGTMITGPSGSELQAYRDITVSVASESGCRLLSLTDDFGFTQEDAADYLLPDLVHYNESGRYRLAQGLAGYFRQ